jgi:hypothetical protein
VIERPSFGRRLVQDTCPPRFEGSHPLINIENAMTIFLIVLEKSVVNFDHNRSLVLEGLDDYSLLDFRVHRMINVFSGPGGGNAFLREIQRRSGASGHGR